MPCTECNALGRAALFRERVDITNKDSNLVVSTPATSAKVVGATI